MDQFNAPESLLLMKIAAAAIFRYHPLFSVLFLQSPEPAPQNPI